MSILPTPRSRIEELMMAFITRDMTNVVQLQSRIEEFWYHMIEGTNTLPIPQSRVEILLKKIIENDTNEIPHAQSRIEEFLIALLTFEIDNLPIPQSRSELYLDYIARNNEPVEEIEYVGYTGTSITAYNTIEKPIKSAILKGKTGYRDKDTGEILDAFEEGRNLELVSVRVPVLTATGKNLIGQYEKIVYRSGRAQDGAALDNDGNFTYVGDAGNRPCLIYKINPNTDITISSNVSLHGLDIYEYSDVPNFTREDEPSMINTYNYIGTQNSITRTTSKEAKYIGISFYNDSNRTGYTNLQLEYGLQTTTHEPFKSNILSTPEDLVMRSNGNVYDELDLITGKFIQRIDESNEVLAQEVVKTVDLSIVDQDGNKMHRLSAFNETTHITTSSNANNSLIAEAQVEIPTKLPEALKNAQILSLDYCNASRELNDMQIEQDINLTMTMSAMTELYELALMLGGEI